MLRASALEPRLSRGPLARRAYSASQNKNIRFFCHLEKNSKILVKFNLQFLLQDDNNAAVFEDIDPALNNTDLDLEMGYPPSATAVY